MMFWSQTIYAIIFVAQQVLAAPNVADSRRPVWNIAHMVNAVKQIDRYLDKGANGIEFDISFSREGRARYTYHAIPCDCFRNCLRYEYFATFLQYLQQLTTPGNPSFRKELVMLILDFKVKRLSPAALTNAGEDVATKLFDHYWKEGKSENQAYIIVSLPSIKHIEVMKSFQRTLQSKNASEYISRIGLDFYGNENLHSIKNILERSGFQERNWLGDGVTNCLGRSTARLLNVLSERDEQHEPFSKVYWWTVDRKSTMRRVIRLGVDALITNYPRNLFKVLNEHPLNQQVRLAIFQDNPWKKYVRNMYVWTAENQFEGDEILYN